MATLIAVDGLSLNFGLQKLAQSRGGERLKVDHLRLAELLAQPEDLSKVSLRFYVDDHTLDENKHQSLGRITKYFSNKGYGFITGTDGNSHFFHHNQLLNKKSLYDYRQSNSELGKILLDQIVTYSAISEDNRFRAENVRLHLSGKVVEHFYQLRREPFLKMLEETGYKLVRCRPSRYSDKSVSCHIMLDAIYELDSGDHLILLSDDPIYSGLIEKLSGSGIKITVATFKISHSEEIQQSVQKIDGKILLLDEHIDEVQLSYDDFEDDEPTPEAD